MRIANLSGRLVLIIGGRAVRPRGNGRNAASVDHTLDARPYRLLHEVAGPFDIRGKDLAGVARP